MKRNPDLAKLNLDFTSVPNPIDALDFANWVKSSDVEMTAEIDDAWIENDNVGQTYNQYQLGPRHVELRVERDRTIALDAESIVANVRPDGSLQFLNLRTFPHAAQSIAEIARTIVETWNLHSFEETPDQDDESEPFKSTVKLDAIAELEKWRIHPSDLVPSFLAQSDANALPGIWFFRITINPLIEDSSQFRISAQIFWRDQAFDNQQRQKAFWKRADEFIDLANEQTSEAKFADVAWSLLYAAARFAAFEHWTGFKDAESFNETKGEAIDFYLDGFRRMLVDNFDDHSDRYARENAKGK